MMRLPHCPLTRVTHKGLMMTTLTEDQKVAIIKRLANDRVAGAINGYVLLNHSIERAFVEVLENAELIPRFTKNDKLKCRQIGIAIGYYVKCERYIQRQSKDKSEAFIQNGYAYKRAGNHD